MPRSSDKSNELIPPRYIAIYVLRISHIKFTVSRGEDRGLRSVYNPGSP